MAIIKCKMCGGDLEITAGMTVAECEYCGSRQTIPAADNEKKLTLFSRANRLRFACEFDKAAGIYESIVADFPQEAEAYWGLVLCKYGIEYVDDPATGRKIPTCHRSSFDSVMDDSNLEQALENADAVARKLYREEAKQIEELRKGIIEVSGKEAPYDIFICYKETDEKGERTLDSVLAQDVYDALTAKGYRVFFSRITLEDKLGQEYEPYIFAALNSAKIMLAFGTDYEYFNAVWVKNEWSRYLQLMTKDKSRHLIPCYKGIDAYDMPKEFTKLQAQDLGKVGAVQDLLRGIEKLLPKKEKTPVIQQVVSASGANVQALIDRGNMALEDGEWQKAGQFFDRALDANAQCAEAYLGKALVDFKASNLASLTQQMDASRCNPRAERLQAGEPNEKAINRVLEVCLMPPYLLEDDIRKAMEFSFSYESKAAGWAALKEQTLNRLDKNRNLIRANQYASSELKKRIVTAYTAIRNSFEEMEEQSQQADKTAKAEIVHRYHQHLKELTKVKELRAAAESARHTDYENALGLIHEENYQDARSLFQKTAQSNYQDSQKLIAVCDQKLAQIQAKENAEAERKEALRRKQETARKKKNRTIATISSVAMVASIAIFLLMTQVIIPGSKYAEADNLVAQGEYLQALTIFQELGSYKDSVQRAEDTSSRAEAQFVENRDAVTLQYLQEAMNLLAAGDISGAAKCYQNADSSDQKRFRQDEKDTSHDKSAMVAPAEYSEEVSENDVFANVPVPADLPDTACYLGSSMSSTQYRESPDPVNASRYQFAVQLMESGYNRDAKNIFAALDDYSDSAQKDYEARVAYAADLMFCGDFRSARSCVYKSDENEMDYYLIQALYEISTGDYRQALQDYLSVITEPTKLSAPLKKVILHYLAKLPQYREETYDYFYMTAVCTTALKLISDLPEAQKALTHYAERVATIGNTSFIYDAHGKLVGNSNAGNLAADTEALDLNYVYRDDGRISGVEYKQGGTDGTSYAECSYGTDGLIVKRTSYKSNGSVVNECVYEYTKDSNGCYSTVKTATTNEKSPNPMVAYNKIQLDETAKVIGTWIGSARESISFSSVYFSDAKNAVQMTNEDILNLLVLRE